ncbi:MAG: T9SS type A sorting domain-containing protein [Chryseobacterium sp.]
MKKLYIIIALMFVITISKAQLIPNAGFENWTYYTDGYSGWIAPDNWTTNVQGLLPMADDSLQVECSPGAVGNHYIKVKNGIASGQPMTSEIFTKFPVNSFPKAFTYKYRYMSMHGRVDVLIKFTKWDTVTHSRKDLFINDVTLPEGRVVSNWTDGFISIEPYNIYPIDSSTIGMLPDTCVIAFATGFCGASNLTDYIDVDDLGFVPFPASSASSSQSDLLLYPNPATFELKIDNRESGIEAIQIYNVLGELVNSQDVTGNSVVLDISSLSKGIYFAEIKTEKAIVRKKVVKE